MKFESVDAAWTIDIFLLLLIGVGPKIAWCPFSTRPLACRRPRKAGSFGKC